VKKVNNTEKDDDVKVVDEVINIENTFSFLEKVNKNYAGFISKKANIEVIDTGSPNINNMIGIGGFPRGRISHVYGPQGSGKSFLSLVAAKNALDNDPNAYVVWFDTERSFTYDWAEKMGIWNAETKKNRMLIMKTSNGVDIFEAIYGKIKKDKFGAKKTANGILDEVVAKHLNCPLIVIDSLASMVSPREQMSPVGGLTVSALSGFLTAEIRRISDLLEESKTAMILINQVRQNLGDEMFGEKYHHPGGENIKHQMSLNIYLEKRNATNDLILEKEKDRNTLLGQRVKVVLKKSRFGPAPKNCETTFLFSEGAGYDKIGIINTDIEVLELAVEKELIIRSGSWYTMPTGEKIQSDNKVQEYMREHPEYLEKLKTDLKNLNKFKQNSDGTVSVEETL